jgi:hypothetical protein
MRWRGDIFSSFPRQKILALALLSSLLACGQEQPAAPAQSVAPAVQPTPAPCDRPCLEGMIDQYLNALVKHDPAGLPLAENVVFVENNQRLQLGDGTWRTMTGMGKYRHYFADPPAGQAAVMTVMEENGAPILYDLRLAIVDRKITEIEALVIRAGPGANVVEQLGQPWPEFLETVPPEQRVSRADLVATANKYLSGMENNNPAGDYSFFADDCDRLEHGLKTTRNKPTAYGHSTDTEFVTMTCRQQFETGFLGFVTRIRDRRYVVVDEERQTVFGLVILDHNGTIRQIDMSNDRVFVLPPYFSTPRTLMVGEAWRIRGDKLFKIEMTLTEIPYGNRPQFNRDGGEWLIYARKSDAPPAAPVATPCDRACLEQQINALLAAMIAHDADRLLLADSIKYTENGQQLRPGDGLWGTLTGLGEYKLILTDEPGGQAGFYGTIIETDVPGVLAARLKVAGNRITEIESFVVREETTGERGGTLTLMAPRLPLQFNPEQFLKTVPGYSEQEPGADMQAVVDRYYAGLDGSAAATVPFATECRRRINGVVITNNQQAEPIDPAVPAFRPYAMTCAEQLSSGVFKYISKVRDRRTLLMDADQGLLLDLTFYDVSHPALPVQVASVGEVKFPPANTGPYTIMAAQLFHIVDGQIAGIETTLRPMPYGMASGW